MRIGHKIKLIDLDASVSIGAGYVGAKYSSAFIPPEMIYFRDQQSQVITGSMKGENKVSQKISEWKSYSGKYFEDPNNLSVKTYIVDNDGIPITDGLPYELITASHAYDTWSFGIVLFELCSGIPLFLANSDDNVLFENLLDLFAFTDKYKRKRMAEITNLEARNLVSQMLMKDPTKRPKMAQVLGHPFITGRKAARMAGDTPEFDVFLSYRVQSDSEHAEYLYNKFTEAGLKVWWDQRSLLPGVPWQVCL